MRYLAMVLLVFSLSYGISEAKSIKKKLQGPYIIDTEVMEKQKKLFFPKVELNDWHDPSWMPRFPKKYKWGK